jgi:hypothetical protein
MQETGKTLVLKTLVLMARLSGKRIPHKNVEGLNAEC